MTIDRVAPGRMLLGLGTSHVPLNRSFGVAMDKPLTALREYVQAVSSIFRGDYEGMKWMASAGLPMPQTTSKIPIYLAGISPKSILLTGELADGSLPVNYAPHGLKELVDGIAEGARQAGRSPSEVTLAPMVHCCVCSDRAVALRSVKQTLSFYARMPFYNRLICARRVSERSSRNRRGDRKGRHESGSCGGIGSDGGTVRSDGECSGMPEEDGGIRERRGILCDPLSDSDRWRL